MKIWTSIVTAGAILALTTSTASARILSDANSRTGSSTHARAGALHQTSSKLTSQLIHDVRIAVSAGGSSTWVAGAITDASERMRAG